MRRPDAGAEHRPISSIREPGASEASGLARSATEATDGRAQDRVGRILPRLRSFLRRRLLSRLLCRRPQLACGDLPGAMSERRDATLFHAVRRHDRGLHFDVRHAVRELPKRRQIRAGCRSELLLPAQGSELGGGARRRRGEASAPPGRYPGDAGNLRADVAAGGGARRSASRRPVRPMRTLSRSSRNPSRSRWFSTPMAWTPTCTRRPRRSLARHQELAWKRQEARITASDQGQVVEQKGSDGSVKRVRIVAPIFH